MMSNFKAAQLEAVDTGGVFEVSPRQYGRKCRKRRFCVNRIEATDPKVSEEGRDRTYIPYYFHQTTSQIQMAVTSMRPTRDKPTPVDTKPIEFTFSGLYGLDEQLQQLRDHISRINFAIDHQKESARYRRPSPVLIHGVSGENARKIAHDGLLLINQVRGKAQC
jgi:hypothetical protein